jgi:hypothetical protein
VYLSAEGSAETADAISRVDRNAAPAGDPRWRHPVVIEKDLTIPLRSSALRNIGRRIRFTRIIATENAGSISAPLCKLDDDRATYRQPDPAARNHDPHGCGGHPWKYIAHDRKVVGNIGATIARPGAEYRVYAPVGVLACSISKVVTCIPTGASKMTVCGETKLDGR